MDTIPLTQKLTEAQECLLEGNFEEACWRFEKLAKQSPHQFEVWLGCGAAAMGIGHFDKADRAWLKAQEVAPENPELFLRLGHQYQSMGNTEKACKCFRQAFALDDKGINPRISLAEIFEKQHLFNEAQTLVEECLQIDPNDEQALFFAAKLDHRQKKYDQAEKRLKDLLKREPKHPYVVYACRYELAQLLDRCGQYDEAMQCLSEAKKVVRSLVEIDEVAKQYDQSAEYICRQALNFPKNAFRTWSRNFPEKKRKKIPRLAFLGGHPRSGTTLLEQVLGSHPMVAAYDETNAFGQAIARGRFPDLDTLSIPLLNVMRQRYVRTLVGDADVDRFKEQLLLDKNPSPTAMLPLWLRVFPELRVIIALRDPRDVVLSCYFLNIPLNQVNANFLTFERLAKHYADLMDVWLAVREWEGFNWIETRYEDIVVNVHTEGGRIMEFLGLPWHENQAHFYEKSKEARISSPTYHEVTQPIYSRSVGRWCAYEKYLAPILPALEHYCWQFGYACS